MRVKRLTFISLLILLTLLFFSYKHVIAKSVCKTLDDKSYDAEEYQKLISDCEDELDQLAGREKSLASEIAYVNSQINLTQIRIDNSNANIENKKNQIEKLIGDIGDLSMRIDKLKSAISYQEIVLNERLRERYKNSEVSPIIVLFGSDSINSIVQKTEYLKVMEEQDRKIMAEMAKTKDAYDNQKNLFEQTKAKEEGLKAQLENERANLQVFVDRLADQKAEKDRLLEVTQNDEAKYQKLLDDAKRELNQILGAVSVLKGTESKDVKRGDVIGIQGNTGNSTGEHLHFGVYKYSSFDEIDGWNWYYSNYVDPAKMLQPREVQWLSCGDTTKRIGTGGWSWPMNGYLKITNSFGNNCYKYSYNLGREHPALDIVGSYNSPIYAVADGKAYSCRNCLGDGANGVFIFHDKGYMTIYWHLK